MLKIYTLENKVPIEIDPKQIQGKNTTWIRAIKPDEDEIKLLSDKANIPIDEINEFLAEEERPRLSKQRYMQIIYDHPFKEQGEVSTIGIAIFIYKNIILTLEKEKVEVLDFFEKRLSKHNSPILLRHNPAYFLYRTLDRINDQYLSYINTIDDMGVILKQKAKKFDPDTVDRIYNYSVTLSFFHQALSANHEVLNSLKKSNFAIFNEHDRHNFSELYLDSLAIIDNANVQREMMSNLFNLQTVLSQQKLNTFMNKITFIALIIMVPTLISGIYGMNFDYMPFSSHRYGFWIIIGFMIFITYIVTMIFLRVTRNN